jgi:hypothetical protein
MPFAESTTQLTSRRILIEPEYGYGWLLVGTTPKPIEIGMSEPFKAVVSNVLFDSGVAHAITAQCQIEISGQAFSWIGLMPRTDSIMDLAATEVYCSLILSSPAPHLIRLDTHPDLTRLATEAKIFVHGSAKLILLP